MNNNTDWVELVHFANNNGLTVLCRKSEHTKMMSLLGKKFIIDFNTRIFSKQIEMKALEQTHFFQ